MYYTVYNINIHYELYCAHYCMYYYLPKTKNFDCVGRGDMTSLFFSKVAK